MKAIIIISESSKDYYKNLIESYFASIKNCKNVKLFSWDDNGKKYKGIVNRIDSLQSSDVKRYDFYVNENNLLSILQQKPSGDEKKNNSLLVENVIQNLNIVSHDIFIAEHRTDGRVAKV